MNKVIVVRHGERIDEVDPRSWLQHCKDTYGTKTVEFEYRVNDPYLTEEGCRQAQEVAESIALELQDSDIPYIYSSKLVRSVQTAYYIALKLSKPIVLSRGFAMTAAAVENIGSHFKFLSLQKIEELCPGVEFIDGDIDGRHLLPSHSWVHPFHHITSESVALVVAHRESIRNLAQRHCKTPYCCYGIFHYPPNSQLLESIRLTRLSHRNGDDIESQIKKKKPESENDEVYDFLK